MGCFWRAKVTASKGQNQSQKVKAPGKLTWLNLRKDPLQSELSSWGHHFWKACAPSLKAKLSGSSGSGGSGGCQPRELVSLLSREVLLPLLNRQELLAAPGEPQAVLNSPGRFSVTVLPSFPPRMQLFSTLLLVGMAQNSGFVQIKDFLVSSPG